MLHLEGKDLVIPAMFGIRLAAEIFPKVLNEENKVSLKGDSV